MPAETFDGVGSGSSRSWTLGETWTRIYFPAWVRLITIRADGTFYVQGDPNSGPVDGQVDEQAYPLAAATDYQININAAPGDEDPPSIAVALGLDGTATRVHVLAEALHQQR